MKTGVVPIGSNAGGIKEVIKHGETGYIVDVGIAIKHHIMPLNCYKIANFMNNFSRKCF